MVLMRIAATVPGAAPSSTFFEMAFARLQTILCWPACHQFPPERKSTGSSFRCCFDELQGKADREREPPDSFLSRQISAPLLFCVSSIRQDCKHALHRKSAEPLADPLCRLDWRAAHREDRSI